MGLVGLKTGEVAYLGKHSDYVLEQLKSFFHETIVTEVEKLLDAAADSRTELPKGSYRSLPSGIGTAVQ